MLGNISHGANGVSLTALPSRGKRGAAATLQEVSAPMKIKARNDLKL